MQNLFKKSISLCLVLLFFVSLCVFLPVHASADANITKILTTVSSTPVALVDPALITVATSTEGLSITGAAWFDANDKAAVGAFNAETYRLEIQLAADKGYTIDQGVAAYLNNSAVSVSVSNDGKTAVIFREYTAAIWAPTIYKHPGGETVDEGGWASFVVSGSYVSDYQWMLVNPSETEFVMISALKSRFPEMDSSGNGSTKLLLYHIPYELNGWKVVCNFIGAGENNMVRSQGAIITVIPDPSRTPVSPEPVVTEAQNPDISVPENSIPDGTDAASEDLLGTGDSDTEQPPAVLTAPDESSTPSGTHEHTYSDIWNYNENYHWHECLECSQHSEEEAHRLKWNEIEAATTKTAGTEEGTCEICGYRVTREIEKLEKTSLPAPSTRMGILLSLIPLVLILTGIHLVISSKQRKQ